MLDRIVKASVLETFRARTPAREAHRARARVRGRPGRAHRRGHRRRRSTPSCSADCPGLRDALADLEVGETPAGVASAVEFVLEGLHLSKRLNKDAVGGAPPTAAAADSARRLERRCEYLAAVRTTPTPADVVRCRRCRPRSACRARSRRRRGGSRSRPRARSSGCRPPTCRPRRGASARRGTVCASSAMSFGACSASFATRSICWWRSCR